MKNKLKKYEPYYTESNLFNKLAKYAKVAGYEVVEKALFLYYASQDTNVPLKAKAVIYGALAYFISPLDAIPDIVPLLGFSDDLTMLAGAITVVALHINEDVKKRARGKMKDWFE